MAIRQRGYFFDPTNLDRFNDKDIPTEDTMLDWSQSVPFIVEVGDTAQLSRAGISKITTNERVKNRDNQDTSGISPAGFTTFVTPKQLPLFLSSDSSITIAEVGRTGTDDGTGDITDYDISVNFPVAPTIPTTTDDLVYNDQAEIAGYNESNTTTPICDPTFGSSQGSLINPVLTALLDAMNAGIKEVAQAVDKVKNQVCAQQVAIGDIVLSVTPPVSWNTDVWLEPRGQLLAQADYPDLFALIGTTYGGAAPNFALPDLSNDKYLRAKLSTAGVVNSSGGSNVYSLSEANIPEHAHTFNGTTNTDGAHTHPIPTRGSNGSADSCRTGDPANDSFNLASSGAHQHTFSGTTDGYGQNPPNPVVIEPSYNHIYLKMRVK
jgi:microcystin-dependent protein